jgi:nickel-dependent lactate racemase
MNVDIPYGKETITIELPEKNLAEIVHPNKVEVQPERETLLNALKNPLNSKTFEDFISDAKDVLFIVNDGTRPTPTAKVIEIIYDTIKDIDIKFIIATGVHRAPTEDEFDFIFGKHYTDLKDRIRVHDAKKEDDMVFIGTSKNGTEMYVNKLGMEANKIVIIGSVEPHYFGGYTGGRKSFLPGIASYKTIEQNHKYAMQKEAQPLALEGNPVHEDMEDAIKTIQDKDIFSIQTVLDPHHRIYAASAGHLNDSFYAAIDRANEVFSVKIKEQADIVVTVAPYPMDIDLYQSQKALENGKPALKENGIMILVSKCRDGVGPDSFLKLLSSASTPIEVLKKIDEGYKLGFHKAARIVETAMKGEIWAVTNLDDETVKKAFMKPLPNLQDAVDEAIKKKGENSKVLFLMSGSITVPRL